MIRDDGEKPRPGLAGIAQAIERPPCLYGRLLHGVMGLLRITQHGDRKSVARLDPRTDGRVEIAGAGIPELITHDLLHTK